MDNCEIDVVELVELRRHEKKCVTERDDSAIMVHSKVARSTECELRETVCAAGRIAGDASVHIHTVHDEPEMDQIYKQIVICVR